eukprot:SAG31_NODE_611_length_13558_cov_224.959730_1_plen_131_part_10
MSLNDGTEGRRCVVALESGGKQLSLLPANIQRSADVRIQPDDRLSGRAMADPAGFEPQPEDKPAIVGTTFSKEAAENARRRTAKVAAVKAGAEPCDHRYTQHFGGRFSCADCWAPLEEVAPDRIAFEQQKL